MSALAFPPELRTMSIVPRWSICWTLNKDYLTNHSWFVTVYAHDIARMIEWRGNYAALMYRALTHDLDETVTGDIVSPVKKEIIDSARAEDYIGHKLRQRLPETMRHLDGYDDASTTKENGEINCIIHAADRLDALLFIVTEQRLGNTVIAARCDDAQARLEAAWRDLPHAPGCKSELNHLWSTRVLPSIRAHEDEGGFGI